jgi:hypothetical protein
MEEKGNIFEGKEKRSEPRLSADQYCSVEFSISKGEPNYLFEIKDMSASGLCIIVKEGSAVLNHLKVGDTIDMKYYHPKETERPKLIKAEVKHISKDALGRYKGNYLVGLSVLEKGNENP